jgi:hypothetical protein
VQGVKAVADALADRGSVTERTVLPAVSGIAVAYTLTAWLPRVLPGGVFQSDVVATS